MNVDAVSGAQDRSRKDVVRPGREPTTRFQDLIQSAEATEPGPAADVGALPPSAGLAPAPTTFVPDVIDDEGKTSLGQNATTGDVRDGDASATSGTEPDMEDGLAFASAATQSAVTGEPSALVRLLIERMTAAPAVRPGAGSFV